MVSNTLTEIQNELDRFFQRRLGYNQYTEEDIMEMFSSIRRILDMELLTLESDLALSYYLVKLITDFPYEKDPYYAVKSGDIGAMLRLRRNEIRLYDEDLFGPYEDNIERMERLKQEFRRVLPQFYYDKISDSIISVNNGQTLRYALTKSLVYMSQNTHEVAYTVRILSKLNEYTKTTDTITQHEQALFVKYVLIALCYLQRQKEAV